MTEANIVIEDLSADLKLVKIQGQLDESNVDEKIQVVYKLVEDPTKKTSIIFDLEALDYMNSKSIGYLTDIYGKVTESGGKMAIAKAKANIMDILQVVGLTQLIQAYDTLDAAKTALGATGNAGGAENVYTLGQ